MNWQRTAKAATVVLGGLWSAGLLLTGFMMWQRQGHTPLLTPTAALAPIAAGWFVWMYLVADDLCPRADPAVTGFFKLLAGLVFWGATGLTAARLLL